jgi:hypothetical protein
VGEGRGVGTGSIGEGGGGPPRRKEASVIIWKGWGFLVAVIGFGCLLLSELAVEAVLGDSDYYQAHGWPKFAAFAVAAALVWFVSKRLNARPAKVLLDPETGRQVILKPSHSLFFVRMEYWAPIFVVLGIILLFV